MYRYRAFGLELSSDLRCPELLVGTGPTDVEIRLSDQRICLDDPSPAAMEAGPDHFDLLVPRVGRYSVDNGRTIVVTPSIDAEEAGLRLFLLGSAIGALLHQRGVLPLHGAALRSKAGYVLVVGLSGAGKSSLAAALRERGWPMGSDDICAVRSTEGRPILSPGYPESKLWPDVLAMLGDEPEHYSRVRPTIEKRRVPVANFSDQTAQVTTVIVLTAGSSDRPVFTEISGGAQMALLKRHTYRPGLALPLEAHRRHFATIADLATHTRMWHLQRPTSGAGPGELADALVAHLTHEEAYK